MLPGIFRAVKRIEDALEEFGLLPVLGAEKHPYPHPITATLTIFVARRLGAYAVSDRDGAQRGGLVISQLLRGLRPPVIFALTVGPALVETRIGDRKQFGVIA